MVILIEFFFFLSIKSSKQKRINIIMNHPQRERTQGHLALIAYGTYNSTIFLIDNTTKDNNNTTKYKSTMITMNNTTKGNWKIFKIKLSF